MTRDQLTTEIIKLGLPNRREELILALLEGQSESEIRDAMERECDRMETERLERFDGTIRVQYVGKSA